MEVFHTIDSLPRFQSGNAVTIGNFDGIHLGHRRLIEMTVDVARRIQGMAIVVTFHPHPLSVLAPKKELKSINSPDQTIHILESLGIDILLMIPFDQRFSEQEPAEFVRCIILESLCPASVVIGKDHRFGKGRRGDARALMDILQNHNVDTIVVDPVYDGGEPISSSRIRDCIREGEVDNAARLLGRFFRLSGVVRKGWGRGHSLGYATANILPLDQIIPCTGVYATRTWIANVPFPSMTYVGSSPTFQDQEFMIETHLLDCSPDLLDKPIEIDFVTRIRDDIAFPSPTELVEQLARDEMQTRRILGIVD